MLKRENWKYLKKNYKVAKTEQLTQDSGWTATE